MASLLPKKSEAVFVVPAWHPNLRIVENLPDTKVVRTAFFVNGAAIVITIALALYLGIQEWKLHEVNKQVDDWQHQIDQNKRQSAEYVSLYGKFQVEEAKTKEVSDFVASQPVVSQIVLRLGEITPKRIALDGLDFRALGLNIKATVKGAPERANPDASAYERLLRVDKVLSPIFQDVNILTMRKNSGSGRLVIEIFCQYRKKATKKP
jgi:hypothetical protein